MFCVYCSQLVTCAGIQADNATKTANYICKTAVEGRRCAAAWMPTRLLLTVGILPYRLLAEVICIEVTRHFLQACRVQATVSCDD